MEERITGVMIYYYCVCKRKLWYFCHEINMEAENESVMLGKILDENSYNRDDKHINIDNVINIDFIREHQELHEVKKSRAIEEAGIWQLKYYLYYLQKRGVKDIKGKIDYPLLKKSLVVELSENDRKVLDQMTEQICEIKKQEKPPVFEETKLCKNCAYHDLCFI
ncbi:CRISPR-associated protein Cas4 [Faecalicatena contorta]|uniref:CRISPR-associated protein Cas4 n=1 Tax=Faecalicatena contorta TaxID=39482 RepID=UPI001F4810BA|nr:CRISPR-associated protein Cas4 [Faecalicatena contorta]MCF2679639.1 CRISPR-associated protein Cas4 [Faecalicatena contorta]